MLSVIVPVYNEAALVVHVLERVAVVPLAKEIIVVDDGSSDDSARRVADYATSNAGDGQLRLIRCPCNRGKGHAVRLGFAASRGDVVIVQDADLEYPPYAYPALVEPIRSGAADVVYGSRFRLGAPASPYPGHRLVNRALTWLANRATGLALTDVETGHKALRGDLARSLAATLREDGFNFDPEITCALAQVGTRFTELGIRYSPRRRSEGKKIRWRDGVSAARLLLTQQPLRARTGASFVAPVTTASTAPAE